MSRPISVLVASLLPSLALAATTIDAGGPYGVAAAGSVTLTATSSTTNGLCGSPEYRWDLDDDGTYDTTGSGSGAATFGPAHSSQDGPVAQTVRVRVQRSNGIFCNEAATDTATVDIANVAPVATAITVPASVDEGSPVDLTAVYSDVEDADTHDFAWDFGDGTTPVDGDATQAHTFPDNGNFTTTVTVTDDDGGSDAVSVNVAVENVAPTVGSSTLPTTGVEGDPVAFDIVATDPGADPLTITWSWDDDSAESTGASVTHAFPDDGVYAVSATVDDGDGGTRPVSGTITISNAAPVLVSIDGPSVGGEQQPLAFTATAFDPGAADELTVSWDFGDGSEVATGPSQEHSYALSDVPYTLTVTVCDDDGACVDDTRQVTISNSLPTADVTGPVTGLEGEDLTFGCVGTDPGGTDNLVYDWGFEEGVTVPDGGQEQVHAFPDEGTYTVTCTVKDPDSGQATDTLSINVGNADPVITGTPPATVVEGSPWSFLPGLTDPGAGDTHIWSLQGPSGMTLDGSTHALHWTPDWEHVGSQPVTLVVQDADGGRGELSFDVQVTMVDADEDGMSDRWELDHGLDPADATDATTDPDGDGRDNLFEWTNGSNPNLYGGPSVPVVVAPLDGEELAEGPIDLVVENATSPTDEILLYQFELYADATMTTRLSAGEDLAEGTDTTAFTVDVELEEDTWYWWWAAAGDAFTTGDFTAPSSFFFNTANDAPGAPGIRLPFDGSTTADLTPPLVVDAAFDPDEDDLVYSFRLLSGDTEIEAIDGVVPAGTTASWTPDVTMTDGSEYCWYAWATDEHDLTGPDSVTACFFIDLDNQPPTAPEIVWPEVWADTLAPTVEVTSGVDPEGRPTLHIFELDSSDTFDSEDFQTTTIASDEASTTWTPETLTEDTTYHVRVLASDGATTSDWASATFLVNAENGPPSTPALHNPAEGAAFANGDALAVVNAEDPEGQALSYEFEVRDAGGDKLQGGEVDEDPSGTTSFVPEALEPGLYGWTARAIDDQGAASDWAAERTFEILGEPDEDGEVDERGCGCNAAAGATGGFWLLGLLAFVRRRR